MSWLTRLFRPRARAARRSPIVPAHLNCESLEERALLTSSIADGTLILLVGGRETHDHIILRLLGSGGTLEVKEKHGLITLVSRFNVSAFHSIQVDGRGGDDNIELDFSNGDFTTSRPTTLKGGKGDDQLVATGAGGAVLLDGGEGNDDLFGGDGPDVLSDYEGHNHLEGNAGSDSYFLGTAAGERDEIVDEDASLNKLSFFKATRAVTVDLALNAGQTQITTDNDTRLILDGDIHEITGGSQADHFLGTDQNDVLTGGAGDDVLEGRGGDDVLAGDSGSDTFVGGAGDDEYVVEPGGADVIHDTGGVDHISIHQAQADIFLDLSQGGGQVQQWTTDGTLAITGTIENVTGAQNFKNTILGNAAANHLIGGAKKDVLKGDDGDDILEGGGGNDQLFGQGDDDLLKGQAGDDKLFGGDGDDVLKGGPGKDQLDGGSGNNTLS